MNKEIEDYCKATKEQEVQPYRKVKTRQSNFVLNQRVALTKKIKSCKQETLAVKLEKGKNLRIHCSTTAFETIRKLIESQIENSSTLEYISNEDLKGNMYSEVVKVKEKSNTTRRNKRALFTVNIYRTTSSLLINGPQVQRFIQEILPAIQTWAQHIRTVIDMCDQELERMLKKLVKDRRTAASSITADEERADHIEETEENTKCYFQIEQLTKIKNTEGKYQENCTNVERPNTNQKVAKGSQNNEDNITQDNQQNKLPVLVATEQKVLETVEIMQDRDKTEEEKKTNNTGEEMQGNSKRVQAKTEQTEEAETT